MQHMRVIHRRRIGNIRVDIWAIEDGSYTAACYNMHSRDMGYARLDKGIYGFMGMPVPAWAVKPLQEVMGL